MSAEINRVYRLTAIRAPDTVDVEGLNPNWFEKLDTVTTIESTNARPGHQIKAKIEKHLRRTPNQGEAVITNLDTPSRDSFVGGPVRIQLEAGYDDDPRLLFLADLRYVSHELTGTEWLTKLQLADGARAYAHARVNHSFAKGTPLSTVVSKIAQSFGVPVPAEVAASVDLKTRLSTGETLSGSSAEELTRILDPFGFGWSFQNGILQILPFDGVIDGAVRLITTPENGGGMIGSPVINAPKIIAPPKTGTRHGFAKHEPRVPKLKIKHTLYPELTPGEKIQVQSRSVNGLFRIDTLSHELDLFGDAWHTEIEATHTT